MITLEKQFVSGEGGFSSDPFTYRQVKRTQDVALYVRHREGKVADFEVFKITITPKGKKTFEKIAEDDTEDYPSTGKFGKSAWSALTLIQALDKFDELTGEAPIIGPTSSVKEKKIKAPLPPPKASSVKPLNLPDAEFCTDDLAKFNNVSYPTASIFVQFSVANGSVKLVREERRNARGKATKIYAKA